MSKNNQINKLLSVCEQELKCGWSVIKPSADDLGSLGVTELMKEFEKAENKIRNLRSYNPSQKMNGGGSSKTGSESNLNNIRSHNNMGITKNVGLRRRRSSNKDSNSGHRDKTKALPNLPPRFIASVIAELATFFVIGACLVAVGTIGIWRSRDRSKRADWWQPMASKTGLWLIAKTQALWTQFSIDYGLSWMLPCGRWEWWAPRILALGKDAIKEKYGVVSSQDFDWTHWRPQMKANVIWTEFQERVQLWEAKKGRLNRSKTMTVTDVLQAPSKILSTSQGHNLRKGNMNCTAPQMNMLMSISTFFAGSDGGGLLAIFALGPQSVERFYRIVRKEIFSLLSGMTDRKMKNFFKQKSHGGRRKITRKRRRRRSIKKKKKRKSHKVKYRR